MPRGVHLETEVVSVDSFIKQILFRKPNTRATMRRHGVLRERKSNMGKYVFECSVKEVVFEVSSAKKFKFIFRLVPDVGFSSKGKDEGKTKEKTFAVFQPMDKTPSGKVFEYDKFVKMEINGRGGSWLTNGGIGVESKLRIEFMDYVGAADGSGFGSGKDSKDSLSDIRVDAPEIGKMVVAKIVIR